MTFEAFPRLNRQSRLTHIRRLVSIGMMTSHFPDNEDDDDDSDSKSNITITTKMTITMMMTIVLIMMTITMTLFTVTHRSRLIPHNDQHGRGGQSQMIFIIITFFSNHINMTRVCVMQSSEIG